LCQAIKQKPDHPRGIVPAVVITTSRYGSSDRVRGSLAGCDAYLTKPLAEAAFLVALREIDPLFQ
jgi:CheY-like chemotaxis protein